MNEKGRQTKLLAAIAILAMVVCVFAAVMPSTDATGTIEVPEDAVDITDGSVSFVENGVYVINGGTQENPVKITSAFVMPSTATLYVKGYVSLDDSPVKTIAGTVYVVKDANLVLSSTGIDIRSTAKLITEAGATVRVAVNSNFLDLEFDTPIFGSDTDAVAEIKSGTVTITGIDISLDKITKNPNLDFSAGIPGLVASIVDDIPMKVTVDGEVTLKKAAVMVTDEEFQSVIPAASTVTITEGSTFTVNGTQKEIDGTIENYGTLAGTIVNNGTINMYAGASITATIDEKSEGSLAYEGTDATTVSNLSGLESGKTYIYTGTNVESSDASSAIGATVIFGDLASTSSVGVKGDGAAVFSSATDLTVTTYDEKNVANKMTFKNVDGNFTITVGSIAINGQVDPSVDGTSAVSIEGAATVVGSFTLADGVSFTFTGTSSLTIPSGAILNIYGDMTVPANVTVTNNGTINVTGSINIVSEANFINNGAIYTSSSTNITGTVRGTAPVEGLGLSTNMDAISGDLPLSGYAFLTSDLTIPYGKSISVNGGAILDLRGYTLTVLGTLNVSSTGTVIDSGANADNGIQIGTTGVINNTGVIGSTNAPVTVSLASGVPGSVTLANVNGLSFGYKRVVAEDSVSYYLTIAGDASKRGTDNGKIAINDTVYASDALSIGSKVDMTVNGTLNLDNGVELTVTSSGTASGNGEVVLGVGSIVDVDGRADIAVSAKTGDYQASAGSANLGTTTVTLANVKGIELTLTSSNYSKDNALWSKQRMEISGAMDNFGAVTESDGTTPIDTGITVTGTAGKDVETSEDYLGLVVTGTLTLTNDINTWKVTGNVTVTGTISWNGKNDKMTGAVLDAETLIGASYSVQTTVEGVITETYYVTSFQAAIENIANAFESRVTAYGPVDVDFDFTVGADQIVEGDAEYTIDKNATVTVANDGYFAAKSVKVEGRLVVYVNGVIQFTPEYSVKSTDAEYTVTYSGFAAALEDAQPGQTITVEKDTYVEDSVTVPEGVTLNVANSATLGVGYKDASTKADSTADLTVIGTMNVAGVLQVNGDITVSGTMDVTDASAPVVIGDTDGKITVTGTLTTFGSNINETKVNAVRYTALDGNTVYTSLASAADVVNAYDVNKNLTLVGTVSDSASVTLEGTTLDIDGTARLGTITLDEATINVNGTFTGTVAGVSGAEGSTVETSAAFTGVKDVQISCTSAPNDANVNVYTMYVAQNGNSPAATGNIAGAVSVDAGSIQVQTMTFTGDKNTLTVASGAEAVVADDNTLTATGSKDKVSVTVNGTMTVRGTLNVTGYMAVNGTLDVGMANANDDADINVGAFTDNAVNRATLFIAGALNISGEQDREGDLNVYGVLAVEGTVTGAIDTIGQYGYIKAYAGSDMTGAQILIDTATGESQADTTAFHVNGDVYMTVYAAGETYVDYLDVVGAEEFSVPGYDVTNLNKLVYNAGTTAAPNYQSVWYTDADLTDAAAAASTGESATGDEIGTDDNLYAKIPALEVRVTVSVGEGISLYIDDVRITENAVMLSVGTHTVSAVVNPGFAGEVTVSFNGSAVSGSFEVTADMASAAYEGTPAISATGNITADTPTITVPGTSSGDDGMGLTDYLLIILVILIVIMAIMVAFRLMRS